MLENLGPKLQPVNNWVNLGGRVIQHMEDEGNLKGIKLERKVIRALRFRLKNFNFILKTRKSGRWILRKPVT